MSLLEYNCFTVLCQCLLYNIMNQSCVYILSHLSFPPTLPVSPISVITSERQAEFLELDGSFPLALFTHGRVHICQCHCLSSSPHLLPRCVYKSILYGHTVYFHIFFLNWPHYMEPLSQVLSCKDGQDAFFALPSRERQTYKQNVLIRYMLNNDILFTPLNQESAKFLKDQIVNIDILGFMDQMVRVTAIQFCHSNIKAPILCFLVTQSCLTLCNPMDCRLSGSSVHGILQARILEQVAMPSSGDLPNPGIEPMSPTLQGDSLPSEPPGKPKSDHCCCC